MRYPFKCPVCEGKQLVDEQLYLEAWQRSLNKVACRSCSGTGIVWSPEDGSIPVFSVPIPETIQVPHFTIELPCTCPQELKDGKTYVGDNFCAQHGTPYKYEVYRTTSMYCEHANEVPMYCKCSTDCYCRSHTCKGT